MTDRLMLTIFTLTLIVAFAGCSPLMQNKDLGDPASIEDAPDPATISEGDGLALEAIPLKGNVELGEPIYLALRVTNTQQEPITIMGNLRPGEGLVSVFASGTDGSNVLLAPLAEADFENSTTLDVGESTGDAFPIFFGANGWNFSQPGAYQVHTELKVPGPNGYLIFRSTPEVVNVTASAAGLALFAADTETQLEAGKFLLWRSGDHLEAGRRHLDAIAEQYPESAVSAYIRAASAQSLSEPFANYAAGEVRAPDCDGAATIRTAINYDRIAENLRIEDTISQAKCFAASGAWDEASAAIKDAAAIAGDRPEFSEFARTLAMMQGQLDEIRN